MLGQGDVDLVDELVAPEALAGHGQQGSGPQAYKDEILAIRTGLSEYRAKVEEIHLRDGQIVDHHGERAMPMLLEQIGVLLAAAGA